MRRVLAVLLVVLVSSTGYAALDAADRVPGILTRDRPAPSTAPSAAPSGRPGGSAAAAGQVPLPAVDAVSGPLAATSTTPAPSAAGLRRAVAALLRDPRLGSSVGLTVRDGATGTHLLDVSADRPRIPASATKLLTAAAATEELGSAASFATRTVLAGRSLYLVAGGDTLLAPGRGSPTAVAGRAGLADLAAATAVALAARGVTRVRLVLDDTRYAGPRYAPGWQPADVRYGLTGAVTGLGLSTQRARPGRPAPADPAAAAASAFGAALTRAGVSLLPAALARDKAPPTGLAAAEVRSAPLADQLALALADSDNALTEALARQAAAADGAATGFGSVAAWVLSRVRELGVDTSGARLVDSSGLSGGTVVPARVIGDLLSLASAGHAAQLRSVVARLPVAGLSGTLADRFRKGSSRAAAGVVRAKTGTLTGASALAGTLVDRDGRLLVFAVLADRVPARTGTPGARAALDALVARLASCGCR